MKKLIFTALVAIVAVGGAYAQYQAQPESQNPNAAQFNCVGTDAPLCGASTYLADSDTQAPLAARISTKIP